MAQTSTRVTCRMLDDVELFMIRSPFDVECVCGEGLRDSDLGNSLKLNHFNSLIRTEGYLHPACEVLLRESPQVLLRHCRV